MENTFERKKNFDKICPKVPLVPTGLEFRPECNFVIFSPKPTDCIFCGCKRKWKILLKEKEILVNFVRKCPFVRLVKNFGKNTLLEY